MSLELDRIPRDGMAIDVPRRASAPATWTADQIETLKRTVAKGVSDEEFKLFGIVCQHTGLNPFVRQIYAIKRGDTMTIQTGIDGLRLIAERTGKYQGQVGPYWCGPDGLWREVWLETEPPAAARVGILRQGFPQPLWGIARWRSYVQLNREGKPSGLWAPNGMPDVMIAKCAEALGLRKAFPQETSGIETEAGAAGMAAFDEDSERVTVEPPLALATPGEVYDMPAQPQAAQWPDDSQIVGTGFAAPSAKQVEALLTQAEKELGLAPRAVAELLSPNGNGMEEEPASVVRAWCQRQKTNAGAAYVALRRFQATGEVIPGGGQPRGAEPALVGDDLPADDGAQPDLKF